jgi:MFS transporter, OFA family, oxalate/formate antiporter
MTRPGRRRVVLAGACGAIFWPGAFIFGLPGVLGENWEAAFAVGRAELGRVMFVLLAGVGFFMFIVGRLQERSGTRPMAVTGAALAGLSTISLGWSSGIQGVYLWAFSVGAASAFVYIPSLTVVQQWFPERRGLASGLVNLAFGLSAAIISPVAGWLLPVLGSGKTTTALGAAALAFGLPAAFLITGPGRDAPLDREGPDTAPLPVRPVSMTLGESIRTRSFWCLWFTWALAGSAGISMVVLSTAFGSDRGLSIQESVIILTAFNLTNGVSRLLCGYISDRLGRRRVMGFVFAAAGLAYWSLPWVQGLTWWSVLAAMVGCSFGTLFAVSAPLAGERFGMAHFGSIFGLIFTAYGFLAGALGPWLSGVVLDRTGGDFRMVFGYLGCFLVLASLLIMAVGPAPAAGTRGNE